jgi:hypothetical protein
MPLRNGIFWSFQDQDTGLLSDLMLEGQGIPFLLFVRQARNG